MKLTYNGTGPLRRSDPDCNQEYFGIPRYIGDMSIMADIQPASQVLVAARVRPLLESDRANEMLCVQALPHAQQIILGNQCFQFPVDFAFPSETPQSQVFESAVQPLMDQLVQGYDTSVVTYGQTITGKTYTMLGPGVSFHISETEYGIIPRATRYIFSRLKQEPTKKFVVKVSFVSVQSELVRDLLISSQYQQELMLLESDAGYPVITGLQEVECESIEVLYSYLQVGMENRRLEWSNAHQTGRPAQSHSIFTLSLEQHWVSPDGTMEQRLSIARFADLASSEKIYYRGMGGHVLGETIHVDPGLIALNRVIQSISQPTEWMSYGSSKELYRQSTLTRILKESFGGRCYSLVVCCISPALPHFDESLVTLQFADRLRQIRNTPVMNGLSVKAQTDSANDLVILNGHTNLIYKEGDTFGLEFATSQWIKLVASAEGLFNKLVKSNTLSRQERDEIDKWLCLKHECEECIGSEDATSITGNEGRLLEKIDELTETEEKTDSSKEAKYTTQEREEDLKYDSETESDIDSQRPDFIDKLDKYYDRFKYKTDEEVSRKQDKFRAECASLDNSNLQNQAEESSKQHPVRNCLPNNGRRRSIHPGSQLPLMALGLSGSLSQGLNTSSTTLNHEDHVNKMEILQENSSEFQNCSIKVAEDEINDDIKPQQKLRLLLAGYEAKQNQIKQVEIDIEGTQTRIRELQATILEKEQFIQAIDNHADTRANAKQRFVEKKTKLREEYYKIRSQIAQVENTLCKTVSPSEENSKWKKELEKYEKKANSYNRRLKNMEIIKQITGDSAKKSLELEQSLQSSNRLMNKLTNRLKEFEAQKINLHQELLKSQEKMKELHAKCNTDVSTVERNVINECAGDSKDRDMRWIKEEEERQVSMRESSQGIQEQLLQTQSMLDKRDALIKEKICLEKQRALNILEVSARISHLEQVLKDKSTDLEKIKDEDEKEALRMEIHNLRSTRDCLIEQRCALDDKFQKEKTLSTLEERKLLECDEAIEAIDTAIEYKNNLICGRKGGFEVGGCEKGEEMLMARLNKLSDMEMRMLLYKYFQKVIDLRESGRKLEVQLTEKEVQNDKLTWQVQTLTHALQQYRLQAEREIVLLQRQHQEKLHLMLKTFAEESSGGGEASSGTDTKGNQNHRIDMEEQSSLKAENRRLHRRLQDLEATLQKLQTGQRTGNTFAQIGHPHKDPRSRSISPEPVRPEPIPNKNLKQLRAATSALTTKVTRQKNKLIIQQQKPPPSSRSKPANN